MPRKALGCGTTPGLGPRNWKRLRGSVVERNLCNPKINIMVTYSLYGCNHTRVELAMLGVDP